jgi:hypothetical protein
MKGLNLRAFSARARLLFWRYHITLFIVIATGGVAAAMYSLVTIINSTSGATDTTGTISFDQATIKRVQALGNANSTAYNLPSGVRTDPFAEH